MANMSRGAHTRPFLGHLNVWTQLTDLNFDSLARKGSWPSPERPKHIDSSQNGCRINTCTLIRRFIGWVWGLALTLAHVLSLSQAKGSLVQMALLGDILTSESPGVGDLGNHWLNMVTWSFSFGRQIGAPNRLMMMI